MNNKQITSKSTVLKIQQWLVLSIVLFILLPAIFVLTTDGLIKNVILNNFTFFILLLLIPIFTTIIGLYTFSFNVDHYLVEIKANCLGMGNFSSKFRSRLELPRDHIVSYEQNEFLFGLRKILQIKYMVNKRIQTQKFNISLLHKNDRDLLSIYISDIIKENKN
jgi:hypothetical protein